MKKVVLLLTLMVAAAVVAVVLGVRNWSSGGLDAETVLAQAQAQEDGVLVQLTEGKALHQVNVIYRRHGPAAELIRDMATEWYLPEQVVQEVWFEVGSGGAVTQLRGWIKDENGVLLQDISTVGGEVVTKDEASGAEMRLPLRGSVEEIKANIQKGRQLRDEAILHGQAVISSQSARSIVIDRELTPEEIPAVASASDSRGYSIPYTQDIQASRWISRTEVDTKTSRSLRWSIVLVDRAGQEWVVEDWQTVLEVVDAGEVPAGRQ
jgi:hypothetical protein